MGSQDTEITLGTGKMLTLFFGLVALCGLFFGLGFSLGRGSVALWRRATNCNPRMDRRCAPRP